MEINNGKELRFDEAKENLVNQLNSFQLRGNISFDVKKGIFDAVEDMITCFQEVRKEDKDRFGEVLGVAMSNIESMNGMIRGLSDYVATKYPQDDTLKRAIVGFCIHGGRQAEDIKERAERSANDDIVSRAMRAVYELDGIKAENNGKMQSEENPQFIANPNRVRPDYDSRNVEKLW